MNTATFSACGAYRYNLYRYEDGGRGLVVFVMLNPSTADAEIDDATIRRCRGFARDWKRHAIIVVNLYGLRATRPADLWRHADPIGYENDDHIWFALMAGKDHADLSVPVDIVCAWGANAKPDRAAFVLRMITDVGLDPKCLGVTKSGAPRHPLYVRSDHPLVPFDAGRAEYRRGR